MKEYLQQFYTLNEIIEEICNKIEKEKNFEDIQEFISYFSKTINIIYALDMKYRTKKDEDFLKMIQDLLIAFENKDAVFLVDIMRYGIEDEVNKIIKNIELCG